MFCISFHFRLLKPLTLWMDHSKLLDVLTSLHVSHAIFSCTICFAASLPANHATCSYISGSGNASELFRKCLFIDNNYIFTLQVVNYEDCSNMNASGFITFFTYMLQQNGKRLYKGLYVSFKLAPDIKKNTVYLSSYSPLNEGHVSILTNSMLRTYTSDIDERIILR